jgi:hypothetical protein
MSGPSEEENDSLKKSTRERQLKMVGLFVASNTIELLSNITAKFAEQHMYPQTAQIIRRVSPYTIKVIDLLSRIDSNKRISSLEKVLLRDVSNINRSLEELKAAIPQNTVLV